MAVYVGTDIGGTFTDLVMLDDAGAVRIVKAPTTPDDRTRGVMDAFALAAAHGTTAATNAFIERKGVKTGLLTTRGFRDTLRIQRCMASWAGLLDHEIAHFSARTIPTPIVPLELIEEVIERVDYKGAVLMPLDDAAARA